jgi:phage shock protein PspC (stress-responsive transcriptional regulator)
MQTVQPSLFARDDTFFGVCQALGEDFGFNPLWLRLALPLLLFLNPVATLAGYAAAGAAVFLSRWLFPEPDVSIAGTVDAEPAPVEADAGTDQDWVALAA